MNSLQGVGSWRKISLQSDCEIKIRERRELKQVVVNSTDDDQLVRRHGDDTSVSGTFQ